MNEKKVLEEKIMRDIYFIFAVSFVTMLILILLTKGSLTYDISFISVILVLTWHFSENYICDKILGFIFKDEISYKIIINNAITLKILLHLFTFISSITFIIFVCICNLEEYPFYIGESLEVVIIFVAIAMAVLDHKRRTIYNEIQKYKQLEKESEIYE